MLLARPSSPVPDHVVVCGGGGSGFAPVGGGDDGAVDGVVVVEGGGGLGVVRGRPLGSFSLLVLQRSLSFVIRVSRLECFHRARLVVARYFRKVSERVLLSIDLSLICDLNKDRRIPLNIL